MAKAVDGTVSAIGKILNLFSSDEELAAKHADIVKELEKCKTAYEGLKKLEADGKEKVSKKQLEEL